MWVKQFRFKISPGSHVGYWGFLRYYEIFQISNFFGAQKVQLSPKNSIRLGHVTARGTHIRKTV